MSYCLKLSASVLTFIWTTNFHARSKQTKLCIDAFFLCYNLGLCVKIVVSWRRVDGLDMSWPTLDVIINIAGKLSGSSHDCVSLMMMMMMMRGWWRGWGGDEKNRRKRTRRRIAGDPQLVNKLPSFCGHKRTFPYSQELPLKRSPKQIVLDHVLAYQVWGPTSATWRRRVPQRKGIGVTWSNNSNVN